MRILITLFFLIGSFLHAAEPGYFGIEMNLSAKEIAIDQVMKVELTLTYPPGYQPDFDLLQKNISRSSNFYGHPFALNDITVDDPKTIEGSMVSHVSLELQPIHIGPSLFTLYDLVFTNKDTKKSGSVVTPVVAVNVLPIQAPPQFEGHLSPLLTFAKTYPLELDAQNEVNAAGNDEEDLAQIHKKQLPWIEVLVVSAMALAFWAFLRAAPQKPELSEEQRLQLAKQNALSDLDKLKKEDLPGKGFFDQFYVELTQSIRGYIEKRFLLPVSSSTTAEFLEEASRSAAFPEDTRQTLGQFLSLADRVKFGQYCPSKDECDRAQELAVHFIESE
jgi:hypothetical protein